MPPAPLLPLHAPPPYTTLPCLIPLVRIFGVCRRCRVGRCAKISGACEVSTSTADTPLPWYLLNSCEIVAPVRVSAEPLSPRAECCIPSATLSAERRHYHCHISHISGVRCTVPADREPGAWSGYCDADRPEMLNSRTDRDCSHSCMIQDTYHEHTADRQVRHAEFRLVIVINRRIESIFIYISSPIIVYISSCPVLSCHVMLR